MTRKIFLTLFMLILITGLTACTQNIATELDDAIHDKYMASVEGVSDEDSNAKIDGLLSNTTGAEIDRQAQTASYHPLILAAYRGQLDTVQKLIAKGVSIDYQDKTSKETPLTSALDSGHPERYKIAVLLIENGADVNHIAKNGASAIARVLKKNPRDTETTEQERLELFKYLYKNCNVTECLNSYSFKGKNIFEFAIYNDSASATNWLAQNEGYSLYDMPQLEGSRLHYLYNLDQNGHLHRCLDVAKLVLDNNIEDINTQDFDGRTLLMTAAAAEDEEACKLFLSYGADKNIKDNEGKTAADLAYNDAIRDIVK